MFWCCFVFQTYLVIDREGIKFITEENKPTEFDLDYIYPYEVEEEYIKAEGKWNDLIDQLIAETSLTVPPHR